MRFGAVSQMVCEAACSRGPFRERRDDLRRNVPPALGKPHAHRVVASFADFSKTACALLFQDELERKTDMSTVATATKSTIMPALRYQDAPAAIEWLCGVLGF